VDNTDFFYGLEPHWLTRDRLYMVFVAREALCGAWIAGQLYSDTAARLQLQQTYLFLRGWVRRLVARRAVRKQEYLGMDPLSGAFLARDRRNFCIFSKQILDVAVSRRPSLWAANSVGTVRVTLATGEIRKFVLIEGQDADDVAEILRRVCPETKLVGKARPISPANKWNHARRTRFYVLCCAVFSLFAAGFTLVAVGRGNDPGPWAGGVLNTLGALYCGVRAAKCRKLAADENQEAQGFTLRPSNESVSLDKRR